jgi:hypothetical protein
MTQLDLVAFLVSGIVGVFVDNRLSWGIVGVWALLKLLKAV